MHTPSHSIKDAVLCGLMNGNIDDIIIHGSIELGLSLAENRPGGWLRHGNKAGLASFMADLWGSIKDQVR